MRIGCAGQANLFWIVTGTGCISRKTGAVIGFAPPIDRHADMLQRAAEPGASDDKAAQCCTLPRRGRFALGDADAMIASTSGHARKSAAMGHTGFVLTRKNFAPCGPACLHLDRSQGNWTTGRHDLPACSGGAGQSDAARTVVIACRPSGRIGKAEGISAPVLYPVSDECAYNTGAIHVIDGG